MTDLKTCRMASIGRQNEMGSDGKQYDKTFADDLDSDSSDCLNTFLIRYRRHERLLTKLWITRYFIAQPTNQMPFVYCKNIEHAKAIGDGCLNCVEYGQLLQQMSKMILRRLLGILRRPIKNCNGSVNLLREGANIKRARITSLHKY